MTIPAPTQIDPALLERRTQEIAHELLEATRRHAPHGWQRAAIEERLMQATMSDPKTRTQLLRFVDAYPGLPTASSVARHLVQYCPPGDTGLPFWLRFCSRIVRGSRITGVAGAGVMALAIRRMAQKFISGETSAQALATIRKLAKQGMVFTLDILGEEVLSNREADTFAANYHGVLEALHRELPHVEWPPGADALGPRMNLSVKLSAFCPHFDPISPGRVAAEVMPRLLPLLKRARELGAFVNFDVEQYERRDLAFHLFEQVLEHPDMGGYPHLGIVAQSYLRDARETLNHLLERARRRGSSFTVRLVKGAYWDYEVIHAQLMSRGIPVFSRKPRTDVRFEEMLEDLRRAAPQVRTAVASHNLRSIARALALGEMPGANPGALEVQTLFGMGDPIKHALVSMGIVPRVYIPYGPMIPGMGYLVRRLLENTSNDSFLKTSFFIHAPDNDLLRDPREDAAMTEAKPLHPPAGSPQEPSLTPHVFRNCPPIDFAILAERDRFAAALALVREKFGLEYPAVIGDERHLPGDSSGRDPAKWIRSLNPGCPSETVGWVPRCGPEHANHAIDAARRAFPAWSRTPATARARALRDAADYMAARRHEYAAWAVFEAGKPWREADGDVCEAIDFLRYYALEMESLASPSVTQPLPGERNEYGYTPLGPGVVIAPWNFPLAILCGMTAAALVAGNTVVMKPAEQTPVCGWMVYEALARGGGLANGVLNLVPGFGEEVGETLVAHPAAAFIAFTGSVSVGLHINEVAARHHPDRAGVTRVIAEMGGKNAIIVDESADIDAAVAGTIQSAFHYSGQKCSACSRALVLEPVYGKFVARLREAAGSLVVGPADAPETQVGPLIDHEAVERALRYGGQCVDGEPTGSQLVRPMIVEVRDHLLPLAQEEIFGPVLTVIQVRDFDEALRVANSTRFALTAGVYTRTPEHIDRARAEIEAGNLYINRTITGAIVGRQPFGGFKMSGIGSKAGGPDYLKQFLLPRTFTENTMRHGFAPVVPE